MTTATDSFVSEVAQVCARHGLALDAPGANLVIVPWSRDAVLKIRDALVHPDVRLGSHT